MPQYWSLNTDEEVKAFNAHVSYSRLANQKMRVEFITDEPKQRTVTQNRCLHGWLGQVATTLNDAGYDMRAVLKHDAELPWSTESAKEFLWKPVQEAMTSKESTTEMNTTDPSAICDAITRHLGQKLGVTLPPWPSRFNGEQQ